MPDLADLSIEMASGYALCNAVVESIADGVLVLDDIGRIARVNSALLSLLELSPSEIPIPCDVRSRDCPARLQDAMGTLSGEVAGDYEVQVALPSGNRATVHVIPAPLKVPGGGSVRFVRDITAEREALRMRSLFLSQVAHELRTPLQHILGFASLISDISDLAREDYVRFVDHIQSETEHLTRMVNDLVEFSRMENGRFSIYLERVRLDELIADVVHKLTPRATVLGLTLSLQQEKEATWITSDSLRLEQVLSNLMENAFKFVPQGGQVRVAVEHQQDHIVIRVADTGTGIPPEELASVFDSFYQVQQGNKRRNVGLGLGLYICRQIILALGGDIWVESELGAGSTFSFRLPCEAS